MIALWCQDCQKAVTRNTAGGCEVCGSPQVRERVRPLVLFHLHLEEPFADVRGSKDVWSNVFVVGAVLCWAVAIHWAVSKL